MPRSPDRGGSPEGYQLPDAALDTPQSLAEVARLVPKGVICLASALAFHGLTDQMPPKVWIAIGRKDWRPRLNYPPIRIAQFSDELLRRSVERKKIAGTSVPVFGVAKTVIDLFRYCRTVGDALAIEGLHQARRPRKATPAEIPREPPPASRRTDDPARSRRVQYPHRDQMRCLKSADALGDR